MTITGPKLSWEDAVNHLKSRPGNHEFVKACFFDDPLEQAADRYFRSAEWTAARQLLGPANGRALDIGSGRGISAYALSRDGWRTTALEPDASDVVGAGAIRHLASATDTDIRVVQTWGESLPFDGASFDLVHVRQALHHAHDLRKLCLEIGRVLKPGGALLATREHVLSRREDLQIFLDSHPLHHLYGGEHAYLLSEYLGALEDAGIQLTQVLNPLASDINTYPDTLESIRDSYARKLHLPRGLRIPRFLLALKGRWSDEPGRLYTFFGRKRP